MNKLMTIFTEKNAVRNIKDEFRIIFNRFNMMSIKNLTLIISTFLTSVFISFKNSSD